MQRVICGAVQMASSPNVGANLLEAERLIESAAAQKARIVVLPENFALMGMSESDKLAVAEEDGKGPIQDFLSRTAERLKIWLFGGTMPIKASAGKVWASCLVYDDRGQRVGRYDKIHLFDVDLPGSDESYRESSTIDAGQNSVVLDSPFGRIGVAICYDLRFPEQFRQMAESGLDLLIVPAAFTAQTGAAHWDLLVRARSVENLCYTIAANQGGFHVNGRETYGHSMIVDPWGKTLASLASGSGVVCAEIDRERLEKVRTAFPVLTHRRL
ncbi:carbon-nitrogen hydrolase family protein [Methylotetracoccus oryzae]|uniref:carbon-nitrogen hydrolase family protein n=1 Tax=Methylotetracoccus oryzae TaxID=1919059 RepID=UPI001119A1ED|nr:carbon-nitrogen hydrolase family protein [Methylotetracoccus oryzae]